MEKKLKTSLFAAISALEKHGYRYAIIGGIALSQWGIIRATYDIDIKVAVPNLDYKTLRTILYSIFPQYARQNAHENPFIVSVDVNGIIVDFLLTLPGYDELIIEHAKYRKLDGLKIWICSVEDLVIQKAITGRAKDWQDVEALLIAQFNKLDYEYIEVWLIQFAEALEQPGLVGEYNKLLDKATTIHHQYHE